MTTILDKRLCERSNWLEYRRPATAREHRGYWYDPTDQDAFHAPEEIDAHIERRGLNNYVRTLRERPDILDRFMRRLAEHPEERAQWKDVLDAFESGAVIRGARDPEAPSRT